jgi:uncharacterized protein YfaS (alpha-2-macroglobulin family)
MVLPVLVLVLAQAPSSWAEIDKLVHEQKLAAAQTAVEGRYAAAKKSGDDAELARALIRRTQLRIALGAYETAVKDLKAEPWPKSLLPRAAVELYYAAALTRYAQSYSYEIRQRERVDTRGEVDLKAWTADQIYAEAQQTLEDVWKQRAELGEKPLGAFGEYLKPNDYPKGVRDTLRDVVTYLRAESLDNTQGWSPEQSNEVYRLDLAALLGPQKPPATGAHPLARLVAYLDDLEAWHTSKGQREAALEARMQRTAYLWQHFTADEEHARLADDLSVHVEQVKDLPWSAAGRAQLAEWARPEPAKARTIALAGAQAFPSSVGGERCRVIVKQIEAPDYELQAMQADGVERRSLNVTARNLDRVYLRAYRLEVADLLSRSDWALQPGSDDLRKVLTGRAPVASWKVELAKTPDYQSHVTAVVPPLRDNGLYAIIASAREDFVDKANRIVGATMLVTKLVMTVRQQYADGALEAVVFDGEKGEPAAGVDVELWSFEYGRPRTKVDTQRTGADGGVKFPGKGRQNKNHFVVAHRGSDWALENSSIYFSTSARYDVNTALIYTDRSVYRPQQKISWKAIAYHGAADHSSYTVVPNSEITVSLMDANRQTVEVRTVKTNAYGSAAGEFLIPTGRLLGNWSIDSRGSNAFFRVEEYKRPTFEVTFKDDGAAALRLNSPAQLKGEARYYFGLPVTSGQVRWRVSRTPQFPWWWWEWGWSPPPARTQVVATGTSQLGPDGTFEVRFKPEADPKLDKDVTYRYQAEVDITDDGGETRSAEKSIRLGLVAIEARAQLEQGFVSEGSDAQLTVRRTDLDGNGRAGKGTWRLVALAQPEKTRLPADEPVVPPKGKPASALSEGDRLRPRWSPNYVPATTMRQWPDGTEKAKGELSHDAKGEAKLSLPKLPPGAYRLHYETKDDYGAPFSTVTDFVVTGRAFPLSLPAYSALQTSTVPVGGTVRLLLGSAFEGQALVVELYKDGKRTERRVLHAGRDAAVLELPVSAEDRGGFSISVQVVRDYQVMSFDQNVFVPRDDKELKVEFATMRDTLRPGAKETFKVTVRAATGKLEAGAAEVLSYMYDQSLDVFGPHNPPSVASLYPGRAGVPYTMHTVGQASVEYLSHNSWYDVPTYPQLKEDHLVFFGEYGIGGPGGYGRGHGMLHAYRRRSADVEAPEEEAEVEKKAEVTRADDLDRAENKNDKDANVAKPRMAAKAPAAPPPPPPGQPGAAEATASQVAVRANFSETAFFKPNLIPDASGAVSFEFQVPDSVTSWNVWAHAVTKDLRGGSVKATTRTVKDLMVRPYLPRFLREGDQALLKVVVNDAATKDLSGEVKLEIFDPETNESLMKEFGVSTAVQPFSVKAGQGVSLTYNLTAPQRVGQVAFRVVAKTGDFSDGELRPVPLLPSRMHLQQSRFVTLRDKDSRTMTFDDLAKADDPSRINEQLVVTVDAQLFFTVLQALPYLVSYPYECTEQTMNRFLSTGIVSSVFRDYPAVAKMAKTFSKRDTPLETFDAADPNRKLALEETPWLVEAKGGSKDDKTLDVLDPKVAAAERSSALEKLRKAQLGNGAFPWFPGGPPSEYMTLYLLHGFARAAEFKVEVPRDMVQRAWAYVAAQYRSTWASCMALDGCWETITLLNWVASLSGDQSALTADERAAMLAFSFKHWKQHSPYLKGYLALTLKRAGRDADAKLVFDSVMDSAKTTKDEGTFWQPEGRSWLWYNDTIETHAFALRTLTELSPKDPRRDGLVQWLLLNKKLNQWKSTRATAEVIYSLVKYMEADKSLGVREESTVEVGPIKKQYVFLPDEYTGKKNQLVIEGPKVDPKTMSTVKVSKATKGFQFASATWSFSTEALPKESRGDLFQVSRTYFKREKGPKDVSLKPLADGTKIEVGDEVEVQLSIRSKAAAEYVHLKDPRGAGFEPEGAVSKFRWNLGIGWYEEYRDSGTNFFFEQLPAGEYTFKYRVRASMAGNFRVGPATLQSMYAPEFTAYSAGHQLPVAASGR